MILVYIAGPYTGKNYHEVDLNIAQAREAAAQLAEAGIGFFCPHMNSAHFEVITPSVQPEYWYELDNYFLKTCSAVLMLPGWWHSKGSRAEHALAEQLKKSIFYSVEDVIKCQM